MNYKQYFYRLNAFTRLKDGVALINKNSPSEPVSLEPGWVRLSRSQMGNIPSQSLSAILQISSQEGAPDNLEDTVASVIDRLIESETLQLSDTSVELPYHLSRAIEELDPAIAKPLLDEDGYKQMQKIPAAGINTH